MENSPCADEQEAAQPKKHEQHGSIDKGAFVSDPCGVDEGIGIKACSPALHQHVEEIKKRVQKPP